MTGPARITVPILLVQFMTPELLKATPIYLLLKLTPDVN